MDRVMLSLNTNLSALKIENNAAKSGSSLADAILRLSSGMRINGAKDDAAGQAIANRMSSQQSGLAQASRNAGDGISLVETTEGALSEINNRLQRIRQLAVQGLSDVNTLEDGDAIQAEINLNLKEIARLNGSASFNGISVLDGSAGKLAIQVGANDRDSVSVDLSAPGFSIDELGLKDLVINGIKSAVTTVNRVIGSASNLSLADPNVAVNFTTPTALSDRQLVRSSANNQLYIQGNDGDGKAVYYPAVRAGSWDTATGQGYITVDASSASPLYANVPQIPARSITSYSYLDDNGAALPASPAPSLTLSNGQYYVEQNDIYYPATLSFDASGAATATLTGAGGQLDSAFSPLPAQVTTTPAVDTTSAALSYSDASGNPLPAGDARLLKSGSQYLLQVDDGSGNPQYFNATFAAETDGSSTTLAVRATDAINLNSFSAVTTITGTSTVTLDPAKVQLNYTSAKGETATDVLRSDGNGGYLLDLPGMGKTATLVSQDSDGTLLLKTSNGVGDVQIYFRATVSASTDTSTNYTVMTVREVGAEIRLRHPDNPLATLDAAIARVDSKRSQLGAISNRLSSVQNLQNSTGVALAAARSRIEDADYASEVSAMSRAQILQQSGSQLLAKAKLEPQAVLALLQN